MPIKIEGGGEDGGTNEQEEAEYFPAQLFPYKSRKLLVSTPCPGNIKAKRRNRMDPITSEGLIVRSLHTALLLCILCPQSRKITSVPAARPTHVYFCNLRRSTRMCPCASVGVGRKGGGRVMGYGSSPSSSTSSSRS